LHRLPVRLALRVERVEEAMSIEEEAIKVLKKHGFTDVGKPEDGIGDFKAKKAGKNYRIEVKAIYSRTKKTFRRGFHLHGRLIRQQERLLKSGDIPLLLVYFDKIKRRVFKSGYSTKVRPTDKSIIPEEPRVP